LDGKRLEDRAENLWRVHDTLYDFETFASHHPGGAEWLKITKGTDITEAFESHHISKLPQQLLIKYAVRPAATPRLYKFTYNEDGFYKTLVRRVRERMTTLDHTPKMYSKVR
jgi:cytochrome b involved in lipid metabolism